MIARGLAERARMLVLDEPTASLSDEEIDHLFAVIRRLRVPKASASSTSRIGSTRSPR